MGGRTLRRSLLSLASCLPLVLSLGPTSAEGERVQARPSQLSSDRLALIVNAFRETFGEHVASPAIYVDPDDPVCTARGIERGMTSTVYIRKSDTHSDLLVLLLSRDGVVRRSSRRRVLTPSGRIKVLSVLVHYPETFSDDAEMSWRKAQAKINDDLMAFARRHGYATPLVSFENETVVLTRRDVPDPRFYVEVRRAVEAKGIDPSAFQVLMAIDINPASLAGGRAINSQNWIYVGNYGAWKSPITAQVWHLIARTAYHHEMAHLWGWKHDWSVVCQQRDPFAPFITAPVLLGWEDADGDGVPEINDDTPYGKIQN